MADLQGPKIRVGKFKDGKVALEAGRRLRARRRLRAGRRRPRGARLQGAAARRARRATCCCSTTAASCSTCARSRARASTRVVRHGGTLSNNKGINRQGGGLTAPALTPKDMEDIRTAARHEGGLPGGLLPQERRRHVHGARAAARGRRPRDADRQDRARRGDPRARGHHARLRRHHGRARRPRGRGGRCGGAGAAEAHDPAGARAEQAHHHRDPDDGVDDLQPGAHARRGLRRRQRRARRHRRGDALGRDRPRASTRSRRSRP